MRLVNRSPLSRHAQTDYVCAHSSPYDMTRQIEDAAGPLDYDGVRCRFYPSESQDGRFRPGLCRRLSRNSGLVHPPADSRRKLAAFGDRRVKNHRHVGRRVIVKQFFHHSPGGSRPLRRSKPAENTADVPYKPVAREEERPAPEGAFQRDEYIVPVYHQSGPREISHRGHLGLACLFLLPGEDAAEEQIPLLKVELEVIAHKAYGRVPGIPAAQQEAHVACRWCKELLSERTGSHSASRLCLCLPERPAGLIIFVL